MFRHTKNMNNNRIKKPSFIKSKINLLRKHEIVGLIIFSILIIFTLEMLSRRSITKGLTFIMANPLMFVFNVMIVLLTLTVSMLVSRRSFMLILISSIWLGLGITNFVIQCYRSTPLTAMDFYLLKSVAGIIHVYLDSVKMVLISVVGVMVLIAMFILWRRVKKYKIQIRIPMLIIGVTSISMLLLSSVATRVSALSDDFGNLPDAYADYGFAYCFSNSVFERGIKEPDGYSQETVDKVLSEIDNGIDKIDTEGNAAMPVINQDTSRSIKSFSTSNTDASTVKPNIIMVQLESFFDVNKLLDYSFSDNPIPNFTRLENDYSTGYLSVPVYGAGTINTEFEVLTGMNLGFFGTGEYPYRTILQSTTSESVCYNLDELGYDSYILHNNTATFYNRDKVFPMLGFDHFSSIEYMNNIETNPTGWAKDKVLTGQIMEALKAENTRDFIYTITVQSHGKYQETASEDQNITAMADPNKRTRMGTVDEKSTQNNNSSDTLNTDEKYLNQLQYYVNQLSETDQFVGDLVNKLSTFEEPTIVVFFGDHLPSLSIEDDDIVNGNKFQTEYVMWSNYSMEKVKKDLTAYQLSSYVMDRVGYDNGLLTKFHQRCIDNPDYQDSLKLLQYDMLYGDKYVYNGVNPYLVKPMKMGILDTKVTNISAKGDIITVYGENFTPSSVVYLNDDAKETTFVNENTLTIPYQELNAPSFYVAQVAGGNKILSQSNTWTENDNILVH